MTLPDMHMPLVFAYICLAIFTHTIQAYSLKIQGLTINYTEHFKALVSKREHAPQERQMQY